MTPGENIVFNEARRIPPEPERTLIHPLSALALIVVDGLWSLGEWAILSWAVTMPLAFLSVAISSILIERNINRREPGAAMAIGIFLGIVAAVPFPILSTPVGAALLAWAGIKRFLLPRTR